MMIGCTGLVVIASDSEAIQQLAQNWIASSLSLLAMTTRSIVAL
jgi:hypothetical protein